MCRMPDLETDLAPYQGQILGQDVSADALKEKVGAARVRVVRPTGVYTQDHQLDRLCIQVDQNSRIQAFYWG